MSNKSTITVRTASKKEMYLQSRALLAQFSELLNKYNEFKFELDTDEESLTITFNLSR